MVKNLSPDGLYLEAVEFARQQTPAQNLIAGLELFELCCDFMRAGIRRDFPDADRERVEQILMDRLAFNRLLESRS